MGAFTYGGKASATNVSVDTAAEIVVPRRQSRKSVTIQNWEPATNILYLGHDSSVTTTTGLALGPGESITFDDFKGDVWGIADTAATDVRYFEIYD